VKLVGTDVSSGLENGGNYGSSNEKREIEMEVAPHTYSTRRWYRIIWICN
jgi:hypothetical protein